MEPALKQRLIGAMVLIALAVIFLPMLIKGPAPQSGASDVPLTLPDQPQAGDIETRELPLVTPGDAPQGGMVGMEHPAPADAGAPPAGDGQTLPTVDTAAGRQDTMMRPSTAGGDYAVSFGSYASSSDADRVIAALQAARLPGYQETAAGANGRTVYRVRIGPFATQADAEAARLSSTKVRNDIGAKVVVLNADAADLASPAATPSKPATPPAKPEPTKPAPPVAQASKPEPIKPEPTKPTPVKPEPAKPAPPVAQAPKPAATKPVKIEPLPAETPKPAPVAAKPAEPAKPAAAGTGFAVQLGAFGNVDEANKLRDRARAAGFSAFVEQVRTDKGTLNRVRIGPVVNRADADKLKAQVAGKLGIGDALVKPHP
ncbi:MULTISPECIES: SPOR domain-containing protein [unclassified Lysobacter]|uniref:SPOR domain-containing protein n=1 Tax=unclassified Lysobacter TaxID=2635362 RepID=UPI001BE4E333|nr:MULTISPECIES: SPOR domain-containing protein [unclassified Lysobacter]MBT2747105.1 SPOR domain-containing protein [Lysobacter sp. ISL-42]MBT2750434.1 SPOR domain-containing protein [Lysobacter sp. ISL-50]MBT2776280.1 SPOR domain-containing protein [Lysobacter sp. ISL-54]MBT2780775.1 SPOR domain-containing protein [Lysobacter sp. ISL-52]